MKFLARIRRLDKRHAGEADPLFKLGRHSYGSPVVRRYAGDVNRVTVGAFVSIADDVVLLPGGNHRVDWVTTFPFRARWNLPGAFTDGHPASAGPIIIGNDVWIGRGAVVLSGVTVGNGAVIGAESVITRDVRPYAIVAGNPAREIRRRFSDEEIDALERIRWWDWPDSQIRAHIDDLNGMPVGEFIERWGRQVPE